MPSNYDDLDVRFHWNGDFGLDDNGDLEINASDGLLSLRDQIHLICASMAEDWEFYPNKGASLDDYVGEPNNRSTGDQIRERIRISLVSSRIVSDEDLEVRVIPVHIYKILVVIRINVVATIFNNLAQGDLFQTALVFDTLEQSVFFLDKTPELIRT